jgi:hypothetical protein
VVIAGPRRLISARVDQVALGLQVLRASQKIPHSVLHVHEDCRLPGRVVADTLRGPPTELAMLQQRWRDAKDEGQAVYLSGVPGIGSGIVHTGQWIGTEHHFSLDSVPAHHTSSAVPVTADLGLVLLTDGDSDQASSRSCTLMSLATEQPADGPYIAELVSIPIASRYAACADPAVAVQTRSCSSTCCSAFGRPGLRLLEDAQWIDRAPGTARPGRSGGKARISWLTHRPETRRVRRPWQRERL